MLSQRPVLGLVLGLAAIAAAQAQTSGTLRWRASGTPIGLQLPASEWNAPCGSIAFPCDVDATALRLYTSPRAPRSLSLQISQAEDAAAGSAAWLQGLNVGLLGRAGIAEEFGLSLYGRMGMSPGRTTRAGLTGSEAGLTYGVGLAWDFSRHGSATLGWDLYDFRTAGGDARDVRATSLGLRWRY